MADYEMVNNQPPAGRQPAVGSGLGPKGSGSGCMDSGDYAFANSQASAGRNPAAGSGLGSNGKRSVSNMGRNPAENARSSGTPSKQVTGTSPSRSAGTGGKKR